jgi:hypothetical protein
MPKEGGHTSSVKCQVHADHLFNCDEVLCHELLPPAKIVSSITGRLWEYICQKRPETWQNVACWFIMTACLPVPTGHDQEHDFVPSHLTT